MSAFTRRFIIVARADVAARANAAASKPDTDNGGRGDQTFTVGLSASGNPPATAYWCNWALTTVQAAAIRQRLRDEGATVAETTPVPKGQQPASTRFGLFDADLYTPDEVLVLLGLKRVETVP